MWVILIILCGLVWYGINNDDEHVSKVTVDNEVQADTNYIVLDRCLYRFQDGIVYLMGLDGPVVRKLPVSDGMIYGYYERSAPPEWHGVYDRNLGHSNWWWVYDENHNLKVGSIKENGFDCDIILYRLEYALTMLKVHDKALEDVCARELGKKHKCKGFNGDSLWKCAYCVEKYLYDEKTRELLTRYNGDSIGAAAAFICNAYDAKSLNEYGKWYPLRPEELEAVKVQ